MLKVGIIGCGAIGRAVALAIAKQYKQQARVVFLCDHVAHKAWSLARRFKQQPRVVTQDSLITQSDFIIEAAAPEIACEVALKGLRAGKQVLILSIGGLVNDKKLSQLKRVRRGTLHLPSGAIAGIDGVLAAKVGKIKRIELITRKPPKSLDGAPFFNTHRLKPHQIHRETLLFSGTARAATKLFPRNVNVSALLSLAGVGFDRTRVKVYASPSYRVNSHEITLTSDFGTITTKSSSKPSQDNPRSSQLAVLSVLATLGKILSPIRIGT